MDLTIVIEELEYDILEEQRALDNGYDGDYLISENNRKLYEQSIIQKAVAVNILKDHME